MQSAEKNFTEVKIKVQKLIHLHNNLREELTHLETLNSKLNEKIDEQKQKIKELENQNKALKLAQAFTHGAGGDQNTRELKSRINEYIREIDKCLAFLHK